MNYVYVLIVYLCQPLTAIILFSNTFSDKSPFTFKKLFSEFLLLLATISINYAILYIWRLDKRDFMGRISLLLVFFVIYLGIILLFYVIHTSSKYLLHKLTLLTMYMELTCAAYSLFNCLFSVSPPAQAAACILIYIGTAVIMNRRFLLPAGGISPIIFWGNACAAFLVWVSEWVYGKYFVYSPNDNKLLCLILFVMSILGYLNFNNYLSQSNKVALANEEKRRMQINKLEIENVQEQLQQAQTLRHEFKNHVFMLDTYIKNKDLSSLASYIDTLGGAYCRSSFFSCGNVTIDAIINYEKQRCDEKNISFQFSASVPAEMELNIMDLSAVLFNLIDNAIEASEKTPEPLIEGILAKEKNYLTLTLKNKVFYDILGQNPSFKSTKEDKSAHGIGLRVVKNIVEKYDGAIHFSQQENVFMVSLMMKDISRNNQEKRL